MRGNLTEGKSFGSRRVFASEKTVLMSTFVRLVGSLKANLDKRMITKAVSDYAFLKGEFKDALFGILGSYQKGEITSEIMETLWRSEIKDAWEKAYEHGMRSVGNPFGVRREDESWIKGAETQEFGYLGKFVDDIKNKELVMGMEKRLDMYVETLDGVFHHGQVEGSPEFVKIYWHLREAKHCNTCIRLAAGSPYTRKTLPAVPRDGTSECLSSCKCFLQFRYMKEEPEPEEFVVKAPKPVIPPEGYRLPSDKERDKLGQMSTEIDRLRGLIPATSGKQKKELIRQRRDLNIKQIGYMEKHKVYYVPLGQTQKVKFTESIADEVRKELLVEGGPGSGYYGHAGRPGFVGGSRTGGVGQPFRWEESPGGGIEVNYKGVKIRYSGNESSPDFMNTYSDEQLQEGIDTIPSKHRKLIELVKLSPEVEGKRSAEEAEFGRVYEGRNTIEIYKAVNLYEYGTSYEEQFAHEVGHLVAMNQFGSGYPSRVWEKIVKSEIPVSERGKKDTAEDFAESYSFYVNGYLKKEDYPLRYKFLRKLIGHSPKKKNGIWEESSSVAK